MNKTEESKRKTKYKDFNLYDIIHKKNSSTYLYKIMCISKNDVLLFSTTNPTLRKWISLKKLKSNYVKSDIDISIE